MSVSIHKDKGSVTVVALIILVVLTLLGVGITKTSSVDIRISGNELSRKQNFYVAEGGVNREAQEVGNGTYIVMDIYTPQTIANDGTHGLHDVHGEDYTYTVDYLGFFLPPKGTGTEFSRYDYNVDAQDAPLGVWARYYSLGPKIGG
jgi:hypothetical protein